MGNCLGAQNKERGQGQGPLQKKESRVKVKDGSSLVKTVDEQKMSMHRQKVLSRIRQDNKQRVMDEDDLRVTLNKVFDAHDHDGDGELDLDQFMMMLNNIAQRKYKGKGKGKVKKFDREEVRRMLAKNDTDGNVALDKQQFYDLYKKT